MFVATAVWGKNQASASAKLSLRITPPGVFFGIWGIIYISLIVSLLYAVLSGAWTTTPKVLFGVASILNGVWLYFFPQATRTSNVISMLILVALATVNEALWIELTAIDTGSAWDWVNCNIIAFYQGWLTAATHLNIGVVLVYTFGLGKDAQAKIFWIVLPLCVAGITLLDVTSTNGLRNCIAFFVSAIYGIVGALITYLSTGEKSEELMEENKEK